MKRENWPAEANNILNSSPTKLRQGEVIEALEYLTDEKNYSVQKFLGAGSFGLVMLAKGNNQEEVAIKLIIANTQDIVDKAEKEAQIVKDISSPNIVKYKGHFLHKKKDNATTEFYIVTEYCSGGDLLNFRQNNPNMTQEEIVKYFLQFLNGLKDLKKAKTIHGDIKPANILISRNKTLQICDLGLSKQMEGNKSYISSIQGNQMYKPPYEGDVFKVDFLHDVYAAGGILFFLCDPAQELKLFQIQKGNFPNFSGHRFEKLYKIAFDMMKTKKEDRLKLELAISMLKKIIGQDDDDNDKQDDMDIETFEDLELMLKNTTERLSKQIDDMF